MRLCDRSSIDKERAEGRREREGRKILGGKGGVKGLQDISESRAH
jgi:hypothetical protein